MSIMQFFSLCVHVWNTHHLLSIEVFREYSRVPRFGHDLQVIKKSGDRSTCAALSDKSNVHIEHFFVIIFFLLSAESEVLFTPADAMR